MHLRPGKGGAISKITSQRRHWQRATSVTRSTGFEPNRHGLQNAAPPPFTDHCLGRPTLRTNQRLGLEVQVELHQPQW